MLEAVFFGVMCFVGLLQCFRLAVFSVGCGIFGLLCFRFVVVLFCLQWCVCSACCDSSVFWGGFGLLCFSVCCGSCVFLFALVFFGLLCVFRFAVVCSA